ncbi:hypothetical protein PX860_10445 [Agrobacterium leguminum]|uniref:hypothetical protein n=1 Tax=Agrobacterium leguminum TaxID=2792015 RepID=UPI00272BC89D|nr:hypothetical protein [Agrobacterium leguminum]WLD95987.1 hypothetical protein PX860_10445 [Agrobacterium leguminum]
MSDGSKESSRASDAEQDPQDASLVFDFLYYDASRIASFLSQFDPSGHLTQISNTERAHRTSKKVSSIQGGGSAGVVKGSLTDTTDALSEYGQQNSRTFDTRWVNALSFLDFVSQRELLVRDIHQAGMGDFVLFSGALSMFDLGMLKSVWDLPAVKKAVLAGAQMQPDLSSENSNLSRSERRRLNRGAEKSKSAAPSEAEMALQLLPILPHSIQASVSDEDTSVWCTLREDSITINPSDLFMKHGMFIGDDWNMVGILDAIPDGDLTLDDGTPLEIARQFVAGHRLGALTANLGPFLAPAVRMMLGRPADAYGFTPLLIFRSVSAQRQS